VLIGAAAVLLVLIVLLAIPVTLRFNISWDGTLQQDVRVVWAFGLVRLRIASAPSSGDARAEGRPKKRLGRTRPRRRRERREAGREKRADVVRALRVRRFRRRLRRFIRTLWRSFHKDDIKLRIRIGLGDPADTGQLWALLGPISALLAIVREISVSLVPEFQEATFALDTSGKIRLIPGRLVVVVIALFLSPSFWLGMKTLRGAA
jgi:hypothetical protein